MKFGIFFELTVPPPFSRQQEHTVFHNAIEQARIADEVGFDYAWAVEHHFLRGYSHCAAPEVILTAMAMATKNIRLGHGAVVCIPELNPLIRVAERVATMDILSNGRMEVGTARSATWTELGGFSVDPDTTKKTWDEYVHVLPKMWTQDTFSYNGASFSMPERAILPKPYQDPHPPMWVAVSTPGTDIDAAERGLGCLGVAGAGFDAQERAVKEYRRRIAYCNPVGGVVTNAVSTLNWLYCDEDTDRAASLALPMVQDFRLINSQLLWTREAYPTQAYAYRERANPNLNPPSVQRAAPGAKKNLPEGLAIGDPEHIIRTIKNWEATGIDTINFILNSSEMIPQEQVLRSIRLFAQEVMPKFKDPAGAPARETVTVVS
jgi:alkanesulfonate monooxygenase SsuD/methylene tetrahydromethanopterin reductase-like flavin-dependent oxidoreductase (luciferase family)